MCSADELCMLTVAGMANFVLMGAQGENQYGSGRNENVWCCSERNRKQKAGIESEARSGSRLTGMYLSRIWDTVVLRIQNGFPLPMLKNLSFLSSGR